MKFTALWFTLLIVFFAASARIQAQYGVPPPAPNGQILDGSQLDQLLGTIALYPDPLIAEILPAATQPSQIALAYNYISQGGDQNAIDQQPWDGSVKAIARYPDVLKMLGDDLSWTAELGQAFLNQPTDVMESVQRLRSQAQNLGNLETTPQESIVNDGGEIEILPADPQLIYVPVYDPGIIFYQRPYGRHFLSFGVGFQIGPWFDHDFDWHDHHVVVWGHDHPRPENWWHAPAAQRREELHGGQVWNSATRGSHRTVVNRGDRGYQSRPTPAAPTRDNRPTHEVRPAEPRQDVRPTEPPRDAHPVQPPRNAQPNQPPREVRPGTPPRPIEPPRSIQPSGGQSRPTPPVNQPRPIQSQPVRPAPAPAPRPIATPAAPSRPMSAFGGGTSTQTRAASSRGAESRGGGGAGANGGHPNQKR